MKFWFGIVPVRVKFVVPEYRGQSYKRRWEYKLLIIACTCSSVMYMYMYQQEQHPEVPSTREPAKVQLYAALRIRVTLSTFCNGSTAMSSQEKIVLSSARTIFRMCCMPLGLS